MRVVRFLVAGLVLLFSPLAQADVTLKVIVNAANPVTTLSREALSKLYLKKEPRWADGKEVMVIEPASRDAQEAFARQVHQKSWREVRHYYQQIVFATRGSAPIEKMDDVAVTASVAEFPNAIGYVTTVPADPGVKVVELTP